MKRFRIFLVTLAVGVALPACKTDEPSFGIPDDPAPRGLKRLFSEDRSERWNEKRSAWARREREKSKQMFDRMKGDY